MIKKMQIHLRSGKRQGILFRVRENLYFKEKSEKIEII